jgi:hypothetical protein
VRLIGLTSSLNVLGASSISSAAVVTSACFVFALLALGDGDRDEDTSLPPSESDTSTSTFRRFEEDIVFVCMNEIEKVVDRWSGGGIPEKIFILSRRMF